jgi:3-mercaptopyruvate sulfurtransferase SseA
VITRRDLVAVAALVALTAPACKGTGAGDTALDTIKPDDLARRLAESSAPRPTILHVGPKYLYGKAHIPGAIHAGEAGEAVGIERLRRTVSALAHDEEVVVYCGCCPSYRCPNARPATAELKKLGFSRVRALDLPTTLKDDWTDRGHPVEKGEAAD